MSEQDDINTIRNYQPLWIRDALGLRGALPPQSSGQAVDFPHATISETIQPGNEPFFGQPEAGAGGGISTGTAFCFQILQQETTGKVFQWGAYANSIVYNSSGDFTDVTSVDGLLTAIKPTTSDAGWINIGSLPDTMFLEGVIGTWPSLSSLTIKTTGSGGSIASGMVEYTTTGSGASLAYVQTKFRVPIGISTSAGSGLQPDITQLHLGAMMIYLTPRIGQAGGGGSPVEILSLWPFAL